MDSTYLISSELWQSDACYVMVNDRDASAVSQGKVLEVWLDQSDELKGHILFSTSGSSGAGKWVALSRRALLASAQAVNEHLTVTEEDHWLLALPTFHVGGMGVIARAFLASCGLSIFEGGWDAERFHEALGDGVTLTSLVPTQLIDLVAADLRAPDSLRAMLIGGGALADDIYQQAVDLGWPVVETYGMTEASSQIATASLSSRELKVLPCWDTRTTEDGLLSVKGQSLLTAYLKIENDRVISEPALENGWFVTSDRVELKDGSLTYRGRSDRCVKVLGELVDLSAVELELQNVFESNQVAVIAIPDQRRGSRLIAIVEQKENTVQMNELLDEYNLTCNPVARVESVSCVERLPRSALGKVRYAELIGRFVGDKI